jgi:peroxiredoxin
MDTTMNRLFSLLTPLFLLIILHSATAVAASNIHTLTKVPGNPDAPEFNLEDQDGNFLKMSDYKGKVVIVNFWATWCPPCRKEMPSMQRAWEVLQKEDIVMLAINVGEDSDQIFSFTAEYPVEFPLIMDKDSSVVRQWKVRGLPTTYIVNPAGQIVYQAIGDREWDSEEIMNQIRKLKKD